MTIQLDMKFFGQGTF